MKNKRLFGILLLPWILIETFLVALFINCFLLYSDFNVQYHDLRYEKLTFEKYEVKHQYKAGNIYEIYFQEYEKPFQVSSISQGALNKQALRELDQASAVEVYYRETASPSYDFSICELKSEAIVLLSLSDYIDTNQSNQATGMIVLPILMFCWLIITLILLPIFLPSFRKSKKKADGATTDLGYIMMEYRTKGNLIRVYNSPKTCSLVINGRTVDLYYGLLAGRFCLRGTLQLDGKEMLVEAKAGIFKMSLYLDGTCVAKSPML